MNPQQPAPTGQPPQVPNARPAYYDANGQPVYASTQPPAQSQAPIQPVDQSSGIQPQRSSHVTAAPDMVQGNNYDPAIRVQYSNEPGVVHTTRNVEPEVLQVSDDLKQKHEESVQKHPHLNLSPGEFVILDIIRHPIGLFIHFLGGGIVLLVLIIVMIVYPADPVTVGLPDFGLASMIMGLLMALAGLGTFIAVWVYLQNHFYMTNESVIQEIQHSLFSRHEQTVSLGSIEDASFKQNGVLQTLLNYGTIRLSTEGEETTYRFAFVANPREQVATLNNAIEAFKNGRPVDPYEN